MSEPTRPDPPFVTDLPKFPGAGARPAPAPQPAPAPRSVYDSMTTEDLLALRAGDLDHVSTNGLLRLRSVAGTPPASPFESDDPIARELGRMTTPQVPYLPDGLMPGPQSQIDALDAQAMQRPDVQFATPPDVRAAEAAAYPGTYPGMVESVANRSAALTRSGMSQLTGPSESSDIGLDLINRVGGLGKAAAGLFGYVTSPVLAPLGEPMQENPQTTWQHIDRGIRQGLKEAAFDIPAGGMPINAMMEGAGAVVGDPAVQSRLNAIDPRLGESASNILPLLAAGATPRAMRGLNSLADTFGTRGPELARAAESSARTFLASQNLGPGPLRELPAEVRPAVERAPRIGAPAPTTGPVRPIRETKPVEHTPAVDIRTGAAGDPRLSVKYVEKPPTTSTGPTAEPQVTPPTGGPIWTPGGGATETGPAVPPDKGPTITRGLAPADLELPEEITKMGTAWGRPAKSEGTVPTRGEQLVDSVSIEELARKASEQTGRDIRSYRASDGSEFLFDQAHVKRGYLSYLDRPAKGRTPWRLVGGTDAKPAAATEAVVVRDSKGQEVRTVLTDSKEATAAAKAAQPDELQVETKPATEESLRQVLEERKPEAPAAAPAIVEHPKAKAFYKLAEESWERGASMRKSFSGADVADSEYFNYQERFWNDIGKGVPFDEAFAKLDRDWRASAARNNERVAQAPKIKRGPSSGQSSISHRWVSPEMAQTKLPYLKAMYERTLAEGEPAAAAAAATPHPHAELLRQDARERREMAQEQDAGESNRRQTLAVADGLDRVAAGEDLAKVGAEIEKSMPAPADPKYPEMGTEGMHARSQLEGAVNVIAENAKRKAAEPTPTAKTPAFEDHFLQVGKKKVGGGPKTTAADQTLWKGKPGTDLAGVRLRVTPRAVREGEHFLTNAGERLFGGKQGQGGHFIDVEVLTGDSPAMRDRVRPMIEAEEAKLGEKARAVRFRAKGETFRTRSVGAEIAEEVPPKADVANEHEARVQQLQAEESLPKAEAEKRATAEESGPDTKPAPAPQEHPFAKQLRKRAKEHLKEIDHLDEGASTGLRKSHRGLGTSLERLAAGEKLEDLQGELRARITEKSPTTKGTTYGDMAAEMLGNIERGYLESKTGKEGAEAAGEKPPAPKVKTKGDEVPNVKGEVSPALKKALEDRVTYYEKLANSKRKGGKHEGEDTISSRYYDNIAEALRRVAKGEKSEVVRMDLSNLTDKHVREVDGKVTWEAGDQAPILFNHELGSALRETMFKESQAAPPKPKKGAIDLDVKPKSDRYFVRLGDKSWEEVPGKRITGELKDFAQEHHLFAHKEGSGKDTMWKVSEARTGLGAGAGPTLEAALTMARDNIKRIGKEAFEKHVTDSLKKSKLSPRYTGEDAPRTVRVSIGDYTRATEANTYAKTGPRRYTAAVLDGKKWVPVEFDVPDELAQSLLKEQKLRDHLVEKAREAFDARDKGAAGGSPGRAMPQGDLFSHAVDDLVEQADTPEAPPSVRKPLPTTPGKPGEIIRQSEIIQKLQDAGEVPVRVGHMGVKARSALGFFKTHEEIIRTRAANDVSTTAHEIGHAFEAHYFGGNIWKDKGVPRIVRVDLSRLGKLLYGSRKPAINYASEGLAELIREHVEHAAAKKNAKPATVAWLKDFLEKNPGLRDKLAEAKAMTQRYEDQGPEGRFEAFQHVGKESFLKRVRNAIAEWRREPTKGVNRLNRQWLNDLEAIERFAGDANAPGIAEKARQYVRSVSSRARAFIDHGDLQSDFGGGQGLRKIMEPVVEAGKLRQWRAVVAARRALDYFQAGMDPGLRLEDVRYVLQHFNTGEVKTAAKAFTDWHDRLFYDTLVRRGGVDLKVFESLKKKYHNEHYAHFMRLFPEVEGDIRNLVESGSKGTSISDTPHPIQRRKGSGREIRDVLEAAVGDAGRLIALGDRMELSNSIARVAKHRRALGKWIEEVPEDRAKINFRAWQIEDYLEQLKGEKLTPDEREQALTVYVNKYRPGPGENIVTLWHNGERSWYQVHPELGEALARLDSRQTDFALRTLGVFSRMQRAGAVVFNVGFQVANPIKDIPMYMLTGEHNGTIQMTRNLVRGFVHSLFRPESVESRLYKSSGAESAGYWGSDRDFTRGVVENLTQKKPLTVLEKAGHLVDVTNWPSHIREFASRVEGGTRMAEFLTALENDGWHPRKGPPTEAQVRRAANRAANVTVDFRRMGEFGAKLNVATAFFNPSIQSIDKVAREATVQHPVRIHARGLVYITAPTLALWAATKDEKNVHGRPGYLRYGYWMIPFGHGPRDVLRIPMPHMIGSVYAGLPLALADLFAGKNPEAMGQWGTQVGQQVMPPLIPTAFQGPIDVGRNVQSFSGRDIVPQSLLEVPKEQQYLEGTTKLAREVAPTLGLSPLAFDYLFNYWTGSAFREAADLVEQGTGLREPAARTKLPIASRFEITGLESEDYDRFWKIRRQLDEQEKEAQLVRRDRTRAREGAGRRPAPEALEALSEQAKQMQSLRRRYFAAKGSEKDELGQRFLEAATRARGAAERILATTH